mmetsp:Transcript_9489/g.35529  ORF Transcript_9489/g.35529 Transcript_9489/m.35529 type:complete len:217 (+) Transcript_9489:561-1211(+)
MPTVTSREMPLQSPSARARNRAWRRRRNGGRSGRRMARCCRRPLRKPTIRRAWARGPRRPRGRMSWQCGPRPRLRSKRAKLSSRSQGGLRRRTTMPWWSASAEAFFRHGTTGTRKPRHRKVCSTVITRETIRDAAGRRPRRACARIQRGSTPAICRRRSCTRGRGIRRESTRSAGFRSMGIFCSPAPWMAPPRSGTFTTTGAACGPTAATASVSRT